MHERIINLRKTLEKTTWSYYSYIKMDKFSVKKTLQEETQIYQFFFKFIDKPDI